MIGFKVGAGASLTSKGLPSILFWPDLLRSHQCIPGYLYFLVKHIFSSLTLVIDLCFYLSLSSYRQYDSFRALWFFSVALGVTPELWGMLSFSCCSALELTLVSSLGYVFPGQLTLVSTLGTHHSFSMNYLGRALIILWDGQRLSYISHGLLLPTIYVVALEVVTLS